MTPRKYQALYDELWALRHEIGHDRYPIPSPEEALVWAVVHAARALEKHMEQGDEYREWAQCAMMLMLALGEGYEYVSSTRLRAQPREYIVKEVADLMFYGLKQGDSDQELSAEWTIEHIDMLCVGLDMHITAEFQRLRDKWLTNQEAE